MSVKRQYSATLPRDFQEGFQEKALFKWDVEGSLRVSL